MSEYTPTRNEILTALVHYRASGKGHPAHIGELAGRDEVHEYLEESLRGLLELERAAAEKAIRSFAEHLLTHVMPEHGIHVNMTQYREGLVDGVNRAVIAASRFSRTEEQ